MDWLLPRSLSYIDKNTFREESGALMRATDTVLIQRYREGNDLAFSILVKRYLTGIYSYAYRVTQNAALAEDIAQETFIKAWKKSRSFEIDRSFKTWLFSIAHNTAIDFLRREKSFVFSDFNQKDGGNQILLTLTDDGPTPHDHTLSQEGTRLLSEALDKLGDLDRAIMTLHYNEEFTFAHISEILKKPINTIKSRHYRAIRALEKSFTHR